MKKSIIAALLGTTALFGAFTTVNAATFTSDDQKFTLETPDDNWKEIEDQATKMTLSNGKDYVTVTCYDKEAAINDIKTLPEPTVSHDEFEEEVLTYYSTDKDVYVITGLAVNKEDIKDVRFIVNSIQLADHNAAQPKEEAQPTPQPAPVNSDVVDHTDVLYYPNGDVLHVSYMADGRVVDSNGNELTAFADGGFKMPDGTVVTQWNPTIQNADDFNKNGRSTEGELVLHRADGTDATVFLREEGGGWVSNEGDAFTPNGDGTWTNGTDGTLWQ